MRPRRSLSWRYLASASATTILALSGCAHAPPRPAAATESAQTPQKSDPAAAYQRAWFDVAAQVKSNNLRGAYSLGADLIASAQFLELTLGDQHQKLLGVGEIGLKLRDLGYAHHLLVRASEMRDATDLDWRSRLYAASRLGDDSDAVYSMTVVLSRWPSTASSFDAAYVRSLAGKTPDTDEKEVARFNLLLALYDASWKEENGVEPGDLWGALIRALLLRRDSDKALNVLFKENDTEEIVALRIDRRFDYFVSRNKRSLGIGDAALRKINECRAAVDRNAHRLSAVVQLMNAYWNAGRYTDAYQLATDVATKLSVNGYDDLSTQLAWFLDKKGEALEALQRWKEAEDEKRQAAELPEDGGANVSNVINLAALYARLGKSDEALASLERVPGSAASPFGEAQAHLVRLIAGVGKNDWAEVRDSLDYLREHKRDDVSALEEGLVWANDLDAAANLLIDGIRDPYLRTMTLLSVQDYSDPPKTEFERTFRSRWRKMRQRRDVQAELRQVGRIERVPFPSLSEY
jgi:tetratricopeptide (TPR) repeat protein